MRLEDAQKWLDAQFLDDEEAARPPEPAPPAPEAGPPPAPAPPAPAPRVPPSPPPTAPPARGMAGVPEAPDLAALARGFEVPTIDRYLPYLRGAGSPAADDAAQPAADQAPAPEEPPAADPEASAEPAPRESPPPVSARAAAVAEPARADLAGSDEGETDAARSEPDAPEMGAAEKAVEPAPEGEQAREAEAAVVAAPLESAPQTSLADVLLPDEDRAAGTGPRGLERRRARFARNVPVGGGELKLTPDAFWSLAPRHLEALMDDGSGEVAQNSYNRKFKETRLQLIQRLLDPTLSLEETARLLNVCPTTVRRYTNRGLLTHQRTAGDQRRFRLSDVLAFLEAQSKARR